mmetsp:Transcript_17366/g.22545  ORF Transcript_17366/g.22545 Transcript_17366/m.22545 type:complete len:397 (-) Transcript_17366:236-1426(-)
MAKPVAFQLSLSLIFFFSSSFRVKSFALRHCPINYSLQYVESQCRTLQNPLLMADTDCWSTSALVTSVQASSKELKNTDVCFQLVRQRSLCTDTRSGTYSMTGSAKTTNTNEFAEGEERSRREVLQTAFAAGASSFLLEFPQSVLGEDIQQKSGRAQPCASKNEIPSLAKRLPSVGEGQCRLILCRHGQTELNRLNKVQGRKENPPLNEEGQRQAQLLAWALRDTSPQIIASSPLLRAVQTADIIYEDLPEAQRLIFPEFNEIDFGDLGGKSINDSKFQMQSTYAAWALGDKEKRNPGGESGAEVEERALQGISKLIRACQQSESQTAVAVMHSAILKYLLGLLLEEPLLKVRALGQSNCCINALDYSPISSKQYSALLINDGEHLSSSCPVLLES